MSKLRDTISFGALVVTIAPISMFVLTLVPIAICAWWAAETRNAVPEGILFALLAFALVCAGWTVHWVREKRVGAHVGYL